MPISETIRDQILSGQSLDPGYARAQRRILVDRAQTGRGGVVGVVAERGGGKSTFLNLLASKLEVPVTIVECGFRGSDELLEKRCGEAGIAPHFGDLVVPREYLETAHETEEDRNRASIFRIVADISAGNPVLALHHWADCLRVDGVDGRVVVRLPTPPGERELEQVGLQSLLVLRVIAHAEMISAEDIADSLRKPTKEVTSILYSAMVRGWVEELDGRYRLSWNWFRPISRVLERRNLLEPSLGEILP